VPPETDLKAVLDAIQPNNPSTVRASVEAAMAASRDGITTTALSANEAYKALRNDVFRLAEEVDMLCQQPTKNGRRSIQSGRWLPG
jgi:hypothetical protein